MASMRFGAPAELIVWLQRQVPITPFIETGTNRGETAAWASTVVDHVVTIEGSESLHRADAQRFTDRTNIRFLHGDSRTCLGDVVGKIPGPAIFWLDAHWCGEETFGASDECPVLDEMEVIRKSCHDPGILMREAQRPPGPRRLLRLRRLPHRLARR